VRVTATTPPPHSAACARRVRAAALRRSLGSTPQSTLNPHGLRGLASAAESACKPFCGYGTCIDFVCVRARAERGAAFNLRPRHLSTRWSHLDAGHTLTLSRAAVVCRLCVISAAHTQRSGATFADAHAAAAGAFHQVTPICLRKCPCFFSFFLSSSFLSFFLRLNYSALCRGQKGTPPHPSV
jgi:hypothetical protein